MTHAMSWADFYLICFAAGFCFSFLSFVFGGRRTGRLHLPHIHADASAHLPTAHVGTGHAASAGTHAQAGGQAARASHSASYDSSVSPFNLVTLTAFLAWFGGAGYLLTRYSGWWFGFALLVSIASGLLGGGIIFFFLGKVLMSSKESMDPADYEMVGVLGKISSSVRAGGTGEIIYTQMGTRRVCGARSEDGSAVVKGTEVVVTRYEKGIAYVRLLSEMSGDE